MRNMSDKNDLLLLKEFLTREKFFDKYLEYIQEPEYGGKVPPGQKPGQWLTNNVKANEFLTFPLSWEKAPESLSFYTDLSLRWLKYRIKTKEDANNQRKGSRYAYSARDSEKANS